MTDSSPHPHRRDEEEEELQQQQQQQNHQRLCDFCGDSKALLYCRADSAKLCFSCDRQVHSTNQLFTKHSRSQLCDACDSSPASIFCSTETLVLCQNCDWQRHDRSSSSLHNRRPLEGFTGCPSAIELSSIVGFEDVGNKTLFLSEDGDGDGLVGSGVHGSMGVLDGFSDFLVWDTPSVVSLDDLIASTVPNHHFQAMGVPPLPKNRNAACGQHKEEILRQLRELVKLEPGLNYDHGDVKPFIEQSLVPEQNHHPGNIYTGCEHDAEPTIFPAYEASAFQWCSNSGEAADEVLPSTLLGGYIEESCLVPDKHSDIVGSASHAKGGHERQSQDPIITETSPVLPKVAAYELTSQGRDSAISRYKEKKKTRRYDRHIRYESRKVRAESRTRIKGRFAKMDR